MVDTNENLKTFAELPLEKQKKYILSLMDGIKDSAPIFSKLLETIKASKHIKSTRLVEIYLEIMNFVSVIDGSKKEDAINSIRKHMIELKKIEEEEREKDNKEMDKLITEI